MTFEIRKVERKKLKLKIGIQGPSGSGKTYSALLMALGICNDWEKIFFIDTENESASYYSDLGPFNHLPFAPPYTPERYIEALAACESAGAGVIVVDSMSHEWDGEGGCLSLAEDIAAKSNSKNSYIAWGKVTPRHKKFVDKVRLSPVHIITCTRSKQEYAMEKGDSGKTEIRKVGLKSVQREGLDYEYGIVFELNMDHTAFAGKDRTSLFMDKRPEIITAETGKTLLKWANSGVEELYEGTAPQKRALMAILKEEHSIIDPIHMKEVHEAIYEKGIPVSKLSHEISEYIKGLTP